MHKQAKLTLVTGLLLTFLEFGMLLAVKHYREHTSYMLPEPWWIADWLRNVYRIAVFLGSSLLSGLVSAGCYAATFSKKQTAKTEP